MGILYSILILARYLQIRLPLLYQLKCNVVFCLRFTNNCPPLATNWSCQAGGNINSWCNWLPMGPAKQNNICNQTQNVPFRPMKKLKHLPISMRPSKPTSLCKSPAIFRCLGCGIYHAIKGPRERWQMSPATFTTIVTGLEPPKKPDILQLKSSIQILNLRSDPWTLEACMHPTTKELNEFPNFDLSLSLVQPPRFVFCCKGTNLQETK